MARCLNRVVVPGSAGTRHRRCVLEYGHEGLCTHPRASEAVREARRAFDRRTTITEDVQLAFDGSDDEGNPNV